MRRLVFPCFHPILTAAAIDDPSRVTTVSANDGKTGAARDITYTNYKVIGNGSFGVVYQAKLVPSGEEIAIKKVLQDKRFKVRSPLLIFFSVSVLTVVRQLPEPRAPDHAFGLPSERRRPRGLLLHQRRESTLGLLPRVPLLTSPSLHRRTRYTSTSFWSTFQRLCTAQAATMPSSSSR